MPTRLSEEDLKALKFVPRAVEGIKVTFDKAACDVFNLGHKFRVSVRFGESTSLFNEEIDIASLMDRTAAELQANANAGTPRPLEQAVTSMAVVHLLRSFSSSHPKDHLAPSYTDDSGSYAVPVLSPQLFLKLGSKKSPNRTGTFVIAGIYFHPKKGYFAKLSHDLLDVALASDLQEEIVNHPISSLCGRLWFNGTIAQLEDGSWAMLAGGQIIGQPDVDGI